mgnify:CR=1 FL=1
MSAKFSPERLEPVSLNNFHPALKSWFEKRLGVPTEAQALAWPAIQEGRHTLIAAPTGSGKTLAAFYAVINNLVLLGLKERLPKTVQVVYVSPLKALSNDIHRNLEVPLAGIQDELFAHVLPPVEIAVAVRTGDTSPAERQKMLKHPPHILVTTPESLYVLLTSQGGREMLKDVRTVIVDEIHALVGDKRGSHLSLTIERLAALVKEPLQRIGLSATQKPIELVARFLVGNRHIQGDAPDCVIVDTGHRRKLDIRIEVPKAPLTAVMSNEIWSELHERLVELVQEHRTTLVFVNTRRLAERLARALAERMGEDHVSSHHGSMSKLHRQKAERRLKAGELKVLVATASMELGIDIGAVDLVVQFSSPKRIAAFLQRVGRSGHYVGGTPKGIIFPLNRDELVECAALFDSVRRGELDRIVMPEEPLDVLSQQIVAEVSGREWAVDELFLLCRSAYPFRKLTKERFLEIVRMVSEGFTTRRGRRGSYLHLDAVNGRLRARRGARLAALMNGGAIPDMFDYEVVLQPEGITVGTLNEDFALESLAGDIFTLGTHSWQLVRIEGQKVIVHDAAGKPPTVPFWLGEGASRSNELSESVSRLRETLGNLLDAEPLPGMTTVEEGALVPVGDHAAVRWLVDEAGIARGAAEQIVSYLWMGKTGLGVMPTRETLVMERFFDEAGDMHLVIHSPYGSRVNRGWGLALRKKFCRRFNFELQAAATENSIILSLSSSHSFPLEDVWRYLSSKTLRETLVQAMIAAPLFEIRWRWNATRSLAILRNRGGGRVPPQLQRMQAEDLIAQIFPDQIACAENLQGEVRIPKHPLVDQVIHDCLTEAMDIDALENLIRRIENEEVKLVAKDLREPSVFAQEVINARPYAFLDDTEFAERRVNAIKNRGWLDPSEAEDLSRLDVDAIKRVREEAWPQASNPDELHDALLIHGFITAAEGEANQWTAFFESLAAENRAARLQANENLIQWIAAERFCLFQAVFPGAELTPAITVPAGMQETYTRDDAVREIVRGRLEALGPVTAARMAEESGIKIEDVTQAFLALENEGFVFRGRFTHGLGIEEWCERRLLQRVHRYTIDSLRQSIQPVNVQDFMRFLFARQKVETEDEPSGPEALQEVLAQLEGFEAPAASWETDLIPSRMGDYDPVWLDVLCMSGRIVWSRFHPPKPGPDGQTACASTGRMIEAEASEPAARRRMGPVKNTPICLVPRANINVWRRLSGWEEKEEDLSGHAKQVKDDLCSNGASFFEDIARRTGLLPSYAEEGIAELVCRGLAASDSYSGLRALLTPQANKTSRSGRAKKILGIEHAGRWALNQNFKAAEEETQDYETLEEIIAIYLKRWGVLFRSLIERESFAPPWRVLVRVLRRMELRGDLRGGRFVSQVSGEQYAPPEIVEELRKVRSKPASEKMISLSAADPLNLLGTILPGKKVSKLTSNRILFRGGIPLAVLEGGEVKYLKEFPPEEEWQVKKALLLGKTPPRLKYYLGKN